MTLPGARVVTFAFEELGAERLNACWYVDNPASGRVLEKLGFTCAGEEQRSCLARGSCVSAYAVTLDRNAYRARKSRA